MIKIYIKVIDNGNCVAVHHKAEGMSNAREQAVAKSILSTIDNLIAHMEAEHKHMPEKEGEEDCPTPTLN